MKFSGQRSLVLAVLLAAWSNFASAQATITSISPTTIQTGGSLTISGSGFGTTQGLSNNILFSGVPASPRIVASSWTATKIVVTVPASAISGPVSVKVATTTSNAVNLTVTPTVSGVTPTSALPGTQVTVTGSGFGNTQAIGTSSIAFNGVPALPSTWSSTSIAVPVPGSATSGSVTVTVAGQSSSGSSLFTPTPNITAISPAQAATGTPVAISGNSFGPSQGSSSVMFNGVAAEVTNWTNTAVEAIVPNATSGTVTITVNGVPSNGSPFAISPGITSILPNPAMAGSTVTIFGTTFGSTQGSSTVTFNGLAAAVSNWSNGVIVALVPPNVTAGPVVVTVNGMSSNGLGFSLPPPYHYSVSYAPNGAVLGVNDSVNGIWSYRYDDFNRLSSASRTDVPLGLEFQYDQYGNRWQQNLTAGTAGTSQLTFAAAANATRTGNCYHAAGVNNQPDGFCFDAAGNLLSDGVHTYTYDAENRILSVDAGQTATYLYNGLGQRVSKGTGASASEFIYDLSGNLITEVSGSGNWIRGEIYSERKHVGTYRDGTTYFTQSDRLGTERARIFSNGNLFETCVSLPFGDGLNCSGPSDPSSNHLTGKERDFETALDYFGARYYSSALGRFITPDWAAKATAIPYADFSDPQSLNLYTYVGNNPSSDVDADGHSDAWLMKKRAEERWSKMSPEEQTRDHVHTLAFFFTAVSTLFGGELLSGSALAKSLFGLGVAAASTPGGQRVLNEGAEAISSPFPGPSNFGTVTENEGAHIALGFNQGLRTFAREVGATHLLDDPSWKKTFLKAVADKTTKFSFRLDGLAGASPKEQIMNLIESVGRGEGGHTAWELKQLEDASRLKDLHLYQNGKAVPNPF